MADLAEQFALVFFQHDRFVIIHNGACCKRHTSYHLRNQGNREENYLAFFLTKNLSHPNATGMTLFTIKIRYRATTLY